MHIRTNNKHFWKQTHIIPKNRPSGSSPSFDIRKRIWGFGPHFLDCVRESPGIVDLKPRLVFWTNLFFFKRKKKGKRKQQKPSDSEIEIWFPWDNRPGLPPALSMECFFSAQYGFCPAWYLYGAAYSNRHIYALIAVFYSVACLSRWGHYRF